MDGGADVTEHRARPAGHDRRQPPPLARQHRPADGVHAAVHPAQPPACARRSRRDAPDAQGPQLRQRNHPPLAPGQLGQRQVGGMRS